MDQIAREAFYGVWDYKYQVKVSKHFEKLQAEAEAAADRQRRLNEIYRQHEADMLEIQAEYDSLLFYHTVNQTAGVLKDPSFATHMVLDVVGMIPVVGEPADVLNAIIYTAQGNYLDASLSMAGAIPFAGWASSGVRIVKNTYRAVDTAIQVADAASDAFRLADNVPLTAATPPAPSITTITPVPPTVKAPDIPVTMPKTPDVAPALKQIEAAPVLKQIEAPPATVTSQVSRSGDSPAAKGQFGEQYVAGLTGQSKNTNVVEVNGRDRIPDFYDETLGRTTIGESKNVAYQPLTQQLRDDIDMVRALREAGQSDATLDLYVRARLDGAPQTVVSGPLQAEIDSGLVTLHEVIPYLP